MVLLSSAEILQAQSIIDQISIGIYELNALYGDAWRSVKSPTTFGAKFKATVLAGHLENIRLHSLKTNNHHTYEVLEK